MNSEKTDGTTLYDGDKPTVISSETVKGVTMSEQQTEIERITVLSKYGIGLDVMSRIFTEDNSLSQKSKIHRIRKAENIEFIRVWDTEYHAKRQTWNEDIKKELLTHAIDFYRFSDGSIQKRYHARSNMKWEGKEILMGCIVNIKTQKRHWLIWDKGKETALRSAQLIQKAIDGGEDIQYLVMDRLVKKTINALEKKGVTVVIYPKQKEAEILLNNKRGSNGKKTKVKGISYNHWAERQFVNISKCFYAIKDRFTELSWAEAKQLFEAILNIYWEYDDSPLMKWEAEIQRIQLTVSPSIQSKKDTEV